MIGDVQRVIGDVQREIRGCSLVITADQALVRGRVLPFTASSRVQSA